MKRKYNSGFTMVEIIIAMALLAIIGVGVISQLMMTKNEARSTTNQVICKHEGYKTIETLAMMLREAELVSISTNGQSMDVTAPSGIKSRVYFDNGDDHSGSGIEDNRLLMIEDLTHPNEISELAGRATLVGGVALFSRNQNKITIRLRLGDAFDNLITERMTGAGHQGYEIMTTVYLRNA